MATLLPRLRRNLDFMPSPVPDRPGLLIRDSFHYSTATLIIPPLLVACLENFDGEHTELDLRAVLVRLTGQLDVSELQTHLIETLRKTGFLEDETYAELREARTKEFEQSPVREAVHAGSGYPEEPEPLYDTIAEYMNGAGSGLNSRTPIGIAAPHVSPFGGIASYRAAYQALRPELKEKTFIVLGTSHYGEPDAFGLTRKNFETPFGTAVTDMALVDQLAAEPAVVMEDYCHAVEHSIEFQVVFLQYLFGPDIRIVPILCGSFARSFYTGGLPDDVEHVRSFIGNLGDIAARDASKYVWVLGVDMAHMGRRYSDPFEAYAEQGRMIDVKERDRARIQCIQAGDARAFWELVREEYDDLKWCGSAPFYTFLRAVPQARGELRNYQQWNIDEQSVVSFAGMAFY